MIVLDASVVISHLAGDVHSSQALDIIDAEEELALHPLTLECLVGPARVGREAEALRIIETLGIATVPVTDQQPLALARLRAETSLRLPGCCVLAAALETGASLATFDVTLARGAAERGVVVVS